MDLDAAAREARRLMTEHGLGGWTFRFDRARRRAGLCRHDRREISLSGPLTTLYDDADVREVVLHEIAHALVGPRHGHDAVWRTVARRIGSSGRRLVREDSPEIEAPWVGTCPEGHRVTRHRRPQRPLACGTCSPTFDRRFVMSWTFRGAPVPELGVLGVGRAGLAPLDPASVRLGERLRVTAPGRFDGVVGTLVKRGRTRFHLVADDITLTVPFGCTERLR